MRFLKRLSTKVSDDCRDVLNNAQNRLTLGIITVAIGGGLIASAYIKLPEKEIDNE